MSEARQARPGSADEATQGTEARRRERRWTEASIWTERMVSALVNGVKAWPRAGRRPDPWGGKWFSLIDKVYRPSTLAAAWTRVERNKGAAGVDGQGIERFAAQAERYLTELHEQLKDGSYRPAPVKRVEIPKGDGKTRPLGIPTVKSLPRAKAGDRVVQTALKLAIEPVFEAQFRPGSYGFRPGRSCKAALREVDRLLKAGYSFVVDADLKSYFDTIPHDRLISRVADAISDGRILALIEGLPAAGHHEGHGAMAPDHGHAPRGGHLPAAGQHLSAPARPPDGRERLPDGALRGRLRDPVSDGRRGDGRTPPSRGVGDGKRPHAAPGQDADRRQPTPGPGVRLPGLPVRGRLPLRAQEEPERVQEACPRRKRGTRCAPRRDEAGA